MIRCGADARVPGHLRALQQRATQVSIEQVLGALLDDPGPGRLIERLIIGLALHDDNDDSGVCRPSAPTCVRV